MTQLTDAGLIVSRLDERVADLQTAIRGIFGADLDLDPDTVDGQALGAFAESINNLDMLLEEVYQCFDPNSATKMTLSRLVQLNGITRKAGQFSTATVTLGGTVGRTVQAGTLVHSTATLATFATNVDATISASGFVDVACTAVLIGAQAAPATTLSAIDTPVYGLQTVSNAADAVLGRDVEKDGELRARRALSTAYPSQAIVDGINAAIANLAGVTRVKVYENDQPTVDGVTGQAANSIYAVVQGGADADIAQALFLKKTGGVPLIGTTSVAITDSQGTVKTMKFSRPPETPIYYALTVVAKPGYPSDGDAQIRAALAAYGTANQDIGQDLTQSDSYEALAGIPGKSITHLYVGTSANPSTTDDIVIAYDHLATFDPTHVLVNGV